MSTPDKAPSPAGVPDDASLHKIREILVGPTTRAVDDRLDEFRKQIDTANQKTQQETKTRLDALEKLLRSGLEDQQVKTGAAVALAQQTFEAKLDEVRRQSGTAVDQAQRNFESKLDELKKQIATSYERISKMQAETREWIEREMESVRAGLDQSFASFRAEYVDRQSMASLFSEMSFRVASESGSPMDASQPDDDFEVVIDQKKKT